MVQTIILIQIHPGNWPYIDIWKRSNCLTKNSCFWEWPFLRRVTFVRLTLIRSWSTYLLPVAGKHFQYLLEHIFPLSLHIFVWTPMCLCCLKTPTSPAILRWYFLEMYIFMYIWVFANKLQDNFIYLSYECICQSKEFNIKFRALKCFIIIL